MAASGLLSAARRFGAAGEVAEILQHLATAAVEVVGFDVAAINVVEEGALRVAAVAGPPAVQATRNRAASSASFEQLLARAKPWGALRFLDHRVDADLLGELGLVVEGDDGDSDEDAGWHRLDALLAPLYAGSGALLGLLAVDRPRSGRRPSAAQQTMLELLAGEAARAIEERLRREGEVGAEATARTVIEALPAGIALVDEGGRVVQANRGFGWIVGVMPGALVGSRLSDLLGEDGAALAAVADAVLAGETRAQPVVHRAVRPDGSRRWVRSHLGVVRRLGGGDRIIVQSEDVTDERRAFDELNELAHHDALTGLPNRKSALDRIDEAVSRRRPGERVCVMFCDLDGFKRVNDTFGHLAGDRVLEAAARRLAAALREGDALFRLGGDEFVVLCEGLVTSEQAFLIAERLVVALLEDDGSSPEFVEVSMSVGLAFADDDQAAPSALELVSAADHALYRAKREGRGGFAVAQAAAVLERPTS